MGRFLILNIAAAFLGGYLASQKGRSAVGWGLVCFLLPLLLVVVAFLPPVARPTFSVRCPGCGRPMDPSSPRCPSCGVERPIEMVECPACHTVVQAGPVCSQCNRRLP